MSGRNERERDREEILGKVCAIATAHGPAACDSLTAEWALAYLAAEGVLAICNLAETVDAGGHGIVAQTRSVERLAYSEHDLDDAGILSRKTRYRGRLDGTFPKPVDAGGRKLYRAVDVHLWLEDPAAWARRDPAGDE